jgi:hypothetical protein
MLTIVGLTLVGVAGVLLLVYVRPAGRLAHDLAVALRPLSLPLLVLVLVAAARALPLTMAAAVFVVVLFAAARLVVLPEVHDLRRGCSLLVAMFVLHQERRATPVIGITPAAVRAGLPRPVTVLWLSVWFFVVPGLFMVAVLSPSVWLAGRISWVTALAEGAVVLSGAALLVRLFGFSRKPLRAACAVLICLLAARGLVLAGFLPGEGWIRDLPNWHWLSPRTIALWLAVALVLCVLVESLYAASLWPADRPVHPRLRRLVAWAHPTLVRFRPQLAALEREIVSRRPANGAYAAGFVGFVLAGLALVVSVFGGLYVISNAQGAPPSLGLSARPLSELPGGESLRPGELSDEELARKYMPVLVYGEHQRWLPTAVGAYLDDATIISRQGVREPAPDVSPLLPSTCGLDVAPPCYRLTIKCPTADGGCAEARSLPEARALQLGGTVYARVLRAGAPLRRSPRTAEADAVLAYPGPLDAPVRTLLQYWLFYRYDEWVAPTMFGRLVQRHEADWEAITIGFSTNEPLFVAYSAHCGGRWLEWKDIDVANDPNLSSLTHPLVAVAAGSHANYDGSHDRRPPDWASCLGMEGSAFEALTYVWGIEDVTGDHYRLLPEHVRLVDGHDAPMSFPGTWGGNDHTRLRNQRSFQLGAPGLGPRTPSLQALWLDPISTIFCSDQWRPRRCGKGIRPPADRSLIAVVDES